MNKKIFMGIFALLLLGVGGYYAFSLRNNAAINPDQNMDEMGGPAARSLQGYEVEVTSQPLNIEPEKPVTLRYVIKNDKGEIVKNFDIVHEKIMHFITVRKDLAYFLHLHPEFNEATGEFTVVITFPENGPYRLFPDFTPGLDNPQNLPVTLTHDIEVGNPGDYAAQNVVPDTEITKNYGNYRVVNEFPLNARKQSEITYSINISQNGKPVTNLENYLGALGHSVIIKEGTLDFIHTHALETTGSNATEGHNMGAMQDTTSTAMGPKISFATNFPESGVYKIFTQFQHQGKVMTADYIIDVK